MRTRLLFLSLTFLFAASLFAQKPVIAEPRVTRFDTRSAVTFDDPSLLAAAQKAIAENVVKTGGKEFPKPAALATTAGGPVPPSSCCTPGETRRRDVLFYKHYTGKNENKNKQYGPYRLVEGLNNCWVISAYQHVEMTAAGKYSAGVSHQPAGFKLNQSETYNSEYQNVRNYLLTLNLPKNVQATIEAKLNEFVKNYSAFSQSIDTSHAIVQHNVTLWGAGLGNGRSWYEGYVNITETCCPPELRDGAALRSTLKAWVDETAKKYKTYASATRFDAPPAN